MKILIKSSSSFSIRFWMTCLCMIFAFSGISQTDSLSKCACIDSLTEIQNQLTEISKRRYDDDSESARIENSQQYLDLSKEKTRIKTACKTHLESDEECENTSEIKSQTDSLSKCACIDSLIALDNQMVSTYWNRKDKVSESDREENVRIFMQISQNKKRITAECQSQLTSEEICENQSEREATNDELLLILRVIEMNSRASGCY